MMFSAYERIFSDFLRKTWETANNRYLGGRLKPPVFNIALDGKKRLGSWKRDTRTISISMDLLLSASQHEVTDILKHEMAHQYADEVMRAHDETPHGPSFRDACRLLDIDCAARFAPKAEPHPVLARIRKLLALAESQNMHEAEVAMSKAKELLKKYNLDLDTEGEQEYLYAYFGKPRKRKSQIDQLIAGIIIQHFNVHGVWIPSSSIHGEKTVWLLEVSGLRVHLEIAEYVHDFLHREVAGLWWEHQHQHPELKGIRPKRDFQIGILRGLSDKLAREETVEERGTGAGLIRMENALLHFVQSRHRNLRSGRRMQYRLSEQFEAGFEQGRRLEIRKGLKGKGKGDIKYLGSPN